MKKREKVLIALAVYSVLIAIAEGIIYYVIQKGFGCNFASIIATIRNAISCFFFAPGLSIGDAMSGFAGFLERPDASNVIIQIMRYILYLYASVIIIAPLCTITLIAASFETLIRKSANGLQNGKKDRIMIFGYNELVLRMLENSSEYIGKTKVHLISNKNISQTEELALLRKKVTVHTMDALNCDDREFIQFLKKVRVDQAHKIFLMESSSSADFSLYIRLSVLGKGYLHNDTIICCECEESAMRQLIKDYYNQHKKEFVPPKLFDIAGIRADALLKNQPLILEEGVKPFHILIAGFGKTGQELFMRMVNSAVTCSSNEIVFDIIDYHMDKKKDYFLCRCDDTYFSVSEDRIEIDESKADGRLVVNFHNIDICGKRFRDFLNTHTESRFDYAALCMEDVDSCLQCIVELNDYIIRRKMQPFPIVSSVTTDPEIAVYLNEEDGQYANVYFIGSKQYLTLENILNSAMEQSARSFHGLYTKLSVLSYCDYRKIKDDRKNDPVADWDEIFLYKQDSSRYLAMHQPVIQQIIRRELQEHTKVLLKQWFGPHGSVLEKLENDYIYREDAASLAEKINSNAFLREMGKMEHRRWCYMNAFEGWSWAPVKDNQKRQSPYMIPWDELCEKYPEMCVYDLMPLLLEADSKLV